MNSEQIEMRFLAYNWAGAMLSGVDKMIMPALSEKTKQNFLKDHPGAILKEIEESGDNYWLIKLRKKRK